VTEENGWQEYKREVVGKLDDHGARLKNIESDLTRIRESISAINVKVAGFVVVATVLASAVATAVARIIGSG